MSAILAKPYNQYQSYKAGEYILFEGNNYYIALKDSAKQQSPKTASNNWQQVFNSSGLTPSGVTAGTYGDATNVGQFTVDVNGIITSAVNVPITAGGTGTVTSVAMSVPTGLTVTGSPITTAGTLAVTLTAGYVIPTTTEETNWNTAYINRITSLTTTGTSGAATLVANVLNIPQYTDAFTGTVTSVAVSGSNGIGVSGSPITTSGTITLTLGAITPTSVNGITLSGSGSIANTGVTALTAFTGSGTSSGTNTGDQTITLTGDVTGSGTGSFAATIANLAVTTAKINTNAVTYAKMQALSGTSLLLGSSSTTTPVQEITIGTGLTLTGTTLTASGSGGTVTSVAWTTSQGVSASIATSTTTPNITITLGALTGVTSFNGLVVTANTGAITTGTWSATAISAVKGGTAIDTSASTGVAQVTAGTWSVSTALANGTTGTTQTDGDNTAKVATDLFVVSMPTGIMNLSSASQSPADAQTYYFGTFPQLQPTTTANARRVYPPFACTIDTMNIYAFLGTGGSGENSTFYVRKNGTTDSTGVTLAMTANPCTVFVTGLAMTFNGTSDYFEIKWLTPTWVTNPVNVIMTATVGYKRV